MRRILALLGFAALLALGGGASSIELTSAPAAVSQLPSINQTTNWTCTSSQGYELVKVNITNQPSVDAINVRSGCNGTWDRLEIDTNAQDGLKVNSGAGTVVVNGGYIRCHGSTPGAHQDAIQSLAGDVTLRNMEIIGCDTQQIILSNSSARIVVEDSRFYPEVAGDVISPGTAGAGDDGPATPIIGIIGSSGTLNSVVCRSPRFNHGVNVSGPAVGWAADNTPAEGSGNVLLPVGDPLCVYGAAPPPSPPPPPPPALPSFEQVIAALADVEKDVVRETSRVEVRYQRDVLHWTWPQVKARHAFTEFKAAGGQ